ncbi:LysR substrate-binding domain-containing protein [Novosphingobium sp. 1949]|uniref:LysR substrate-binding domain-containing protein n=1 Tax=Novosphingobium organovorum TaxID=2930092 RepID=A0ABT0BF93_9SPHN|nr:LysR family transcriptional regulator [Novosphingobium organovorum]MCJ2183724.1 LysR substrate-binding domain-containing protein [Novosphingobium organovorum]
MDIWELNLRHLRAVLKIAELGTVSAATGAVNLSQPAITQALGRLEAALGVPLFERRHDGMVPTSAGTILHARIAAALTHVRSPHVTMSRLRALLALADSGSYAGASQLTGLSLPSIHRAVNDLALALRRPLVARRGKFVVMTETGAQFAREFRLAVVELEAGLSEIAALRGHETRRIAIGAMPLSRARVLPAAVARFMARRPQVRLTIVEGSRAELVEPLRSGALDVMVGALRNPLVETDLEQRALFSDVPVFLARRGHPLAGTRPGARELARYPFCLPARGPLRDSFDHYFREQGEHPAIPLESGSVMMIRQMMIDSDLLTLLSRDQVQVELEAGWLCELARLPDSLHRVIGMTTRQSLRPTTVQEEFFADLLAAAGEIED